MEQERKRNVNILKQYDSNLTEQSLLAQNKGWVEKFSYHDGSNFADQIAMVSEKLKNFF